jgi:cell wall-associated NlpC family hydrolase
MYRYSSDDNRHDADPVVKGYDALMLQAEDTIWITPQLQGFHTDPGGGIDQHGFV